MNRKLITGIMIVAVSSTISMAGGDTESWADKISFSGDIRLREEIIDQDGKDNRNRARLRARVGAKAKVNDTVTAKIRLASGSDDPVSSNQTLDDGFSTKDFRLDRAYVIWAPEQLPGFAFEGGKMALPLIKIKDLVWDGDFNPEGAAVSQVFGDDGLELILNGVVFSAEERSSDSDTLMYGGQAALDLEAEGMDILAGVGYYQWENMKGFETLFNSLDGFGNDVVEVTNPETGEVTETIYVEDFGILELFSKVKLDTDLPIQFYGDYVLNTEADTEDTGFMIGGKIGKAKKPGSFEADYNYRDLEANAVVGVYTDSDSGGGGTGIEGHKVQVKYQIADNWQFSASLFFNERSDGTDYKRGQFDLIAKF